MLSQPDLQLRTLRLYGELLCRADTWSHKLTLSAYEGAANSGLATASTLVGATSLTVDSDTAGVKANFRDGAFDFVVTTLDEALRAIKNEIRQGRPIAIGLAASPSDVLKEAAERGLAADLILRPSADAESIAAKSALFLADSEPTPQLQAWLAQHDWEPTQLPDTLPTFEDAARNKWLTRLPTLQRSVRGNLRYAWLSPPR